MTKILLSKEKALQIVFPDINKINEEMFLLNPERKKIIEKKLEFKLNNKHNEEYKFYVGISENMKIIGYAYIDTTKGKWKPIKYIVGITPDGRVQKIAIIEHYEKYGKWIIKNKFLKQYIGSFFASQLITNKKLEAITGATISSQAITRGVKKALILFNEFYKVERK